MTAPAQSAPRPGEELLAAAARLMAERGFHGMSMRELARSRDCVPSTLYHYFPSKDALLHALQERGFTTLIATANAALADLDDPAERLYVFIANHLRFVAEHPHVMRVLVHGTGGLSEGQRSDVLGWKARYFAIARGVLSGVAGPEAPSAELERVTYSVFGMINWSYGWYQPALHGSPAEVARTMQRMVLSGAFGPAALTEDTR